MARLVQKFGGTSVADLDRIRNVARTVKKSWMEGNEICVVVSAMAGETNKLVDWISKIAPLHDTREYDTVVAAGEQITSGLLALALQQDGVPARSFLGWQVPIETDDVHGKARIVNIDPSLLLERMTDRQIPVIAGFQSISPRLGLDGAGKVAELFKSIECLAARLVK